jgi:hypothetical protein
MDAVDQPVTTGSQINVVACARQNVRLVKGTKRLKNSPKVLRPSVGGSGKDNEHEKTNCNENELPLPADFEMTR